MLGDCPQCHSSRALTSPSCLRESSPPVPGPGSDAPGPGCVPAPPCPCGPSGPACGSQSHFPTSVPLSPKAVPTLMAPLNKPRTGQQPGGTAWRCQRVFAGTCPRSEEPERPAWGRGPSPLAPLAPLRAALSPLRSTG